MTTALSLAALIKRIDTLNTAAQKMGEEYQEVGLLCLTHLANHGDIGPCNRLLLGMPKSTRRLAMATWMVAHGALVPNRDNGTRNTSPLVYSKDKKTDVEAAAQEKWYEAAPEREISDVFDLQVAIKQLIARAKGKHLKIGGEEKTHEAKAILSMMAAGAGLSDPFAEEKQAAAEAIAKDAADKAQQSAKDAGAQGQNPGAGAQTGITRQTPEGEAGTDRAQAGTREPKAVAKGAAKKSAAKKATGRARANA